MKSPREVSHDETVVDLLKADPEFAAVYLAAALDEVDQPGGQYALTQLVPVRRVELPTFALRMRCSTN